MSLENKRTEEIDGYEHPDDTSCYNNYSFYKTFDENKKKKSFCSSKKEGNKYLNIISEYEEEVCPICKEKSIKNCNCVYGDNICKNNHIWYVSRDGTTKIGNPH